MSCGGMRAEARAVDTFMCRLAAVLDTGNPCAFALCQGSDIMGAHSCALEVIAQIQRGLEAFNSRRLRNLQAVMLMRRGAPTRWQFDGIWLSGPEGWLYLITGRVSSVALAVQKWPEMWEAVD